jgi:hypothetical protein
MANNNKEVLKVLDFYGDQTTEAMRNILIRKKKRATGRLINSIDYDIRLTRGRPTLNIMFEDYGYHVAGRDPDTGAKGPTPRWGAKGPPIKAIRQWLISKNIPFTMFKGKKMTRDQKLDALTYMIIRKIKIRKKLNPAFNNPTDFLKPKENILGGKKFRKDMAKAFKKDALVELKKK